jgi:molybdopterin molybdotransferase
MAVTIQIPYMLTRYSDERTEVVVEGATMGEAYEALFEELPDLRIRLLDKHGNIPPYLIVLHGSQEVERAAWAERPLRDGDLLNIVPGVEGGGGDAADVRMKGFRERVSVERAREVALAGLSIRVESRGLDKVAGARITEEVRSEVAVPPFDRAAMDGYAIFAEDSFGATVYDPVSLDVRGEIFPGVTETPRLSPGTALRIMTGAPLPEGADAVVKAEDARELQGRVEVTAPVTPGKHVGRRGEDIAVGDLVLEAGRCLRPQDVGLLASIGVASLAVERAPRVGILVSGNELLPPGARPEGTRIVDSNTPMLQALVEADGGEVAQCWRLADDAALIRRALADESVDLLLCAGGSSVGREDYLPGLVRELGELPVHGVAMRPSSPTGIGSIGGRRVFLLPGNPVSCLCAYDFFAGPAIRRLAGRREDWPYARSRATLSRRISSVVGRVDYVRVMRDAEGLIEPIAASGASILSSTTRAWGFVLVPEGGEGFAEGEEVEVFAYDARRSER